MKFTKTVNDPTPVHHPRSTGLQAFLTWRLRDCYCFVWRL